MGTQVSSRKISHRWLPPTAEAEVSFKGSNSALLPLEVCFGSFLTGLPEYGDPESCNRSLATAEKSS